jgi:hypothetical protein
MIIGIAMQHPAGAALPPLDRCGEQKATIETGDPTKDVLTTQTMSSLHDPSSVYDSHDQVRQEVGQMPLMYPAMNDVAPNSQMYATDPMTAQLHQQQIMGQLEAQFGHFGLLEQPCNSDHLDSSGHNSNSDNNNAEDIEGDEAEEEPVKLFVGQVSDCCFFSFILICFVFLR